MPNKARKAMNFLKIDGHSIRMSLRLLTVLLCALVLSCGDVESNPGPARRQTQRTLSFCQQQPQADTEYARSVRDTNDDSSQNNDVMAFLRDMKTEMRTGLASINTKIDDICETMNTLKNENEELKRSNFELKEEVSSLKVKLDKLESHSRRNNLRFNGISGEMTEDWSVSEEKVRDFIKNDLGLPDLENVEIERAHRIRGHDRQKSTIIVKFSKFKDKETILNKAKTTFDRSSEFSVQADYTDRVKLHRRELGKRMVRERNSGKYAAISYDKLIVENDIYRYDESMDEIVHIGMVRGQRRRQNRNGTDGQYARDRTYSASQRVPRNDQRLVDENSSGAIG